MARRSEQKIALLSQDLALGAYLDALLQTEVEDEVRSEPPEVVEPPRPVSSTALTVVPLPAPETETEMSEPEAVPSWAHEGFQCLLFHVGVLKLAVPLVKLTRILPWGGHITATPGRPDWFLGLLAHGQEKTGVIDTGRLVFPRDRRSQDSAQEQDVEPGHILLVEGGRWGLTCDTLGEIIELSPDKVSWRTLQTSRRWLAGTVLDQMCALLDVEVLAQMAGEAGDFSE